MVRNILVRLINRIETNLLVHRTKRAGILFGGVLVAALMIFITAVVVLLLVARNQLTSTTGN